MNYSYRHFLLQAQANLAQQGSSNSKQFAQFLSLLMVCCCLSVMMSNFVDGPELMQLLTNWFLVESADVTLMGALLVSPFYMQQLFCLCFIIYLLFYHLASERAEHFSVTSQLHGIDYDAHSCRAPPRLTLDV
ncbi:hypothetical protein [Shewanella sp. Isolate11]|uniref:hypothetical protein n=1 Tax=Shewanella sp. Isolate11 TaxID=2908530 RepID=UPI001EFCBF5A|nr:hypothetical protein [Shewanella sp. Isolate11]MCG9695453.1 hypothetical protein [Shewanella sp. Isolate11]